MQIKITQSIYFPNSLHKEGQFEIYYQKFASKLRLLHVLLEILLVKGCDSE